jgi:hypothetical protein
MVPRTSRALPAINLALRPLTLRRDADRAIDTMLRRHHIDEDADPDFISGMRVLLHQAAHVDGLSPLGWFSFYTDIETRLANRARVHSILTDHPEIVSERIERPIIVVGLPRTATTLTHHILAGADGVRGPQLWELMHTSLELPERERRKIIRGIDSAMRTVTALAPAMRIIHPQRATRPDECAFYLPHGEQHLARAPMPWYEKWLKEHDYSDDYTYLKQGLQILQHGRPRARWVIKCPTHLGHLNVVMKLFPDATIVWTHRDPVTVVGSICSLVETSRAIHLHHVDLPDIGRMALSTMANLVERGRDARTDIGAGHIIDLPYPALTARPYRVVKDLYLLLGLKWTAEDEARLQEAGHRGPGRSHEYTLTRYGIDEADVREAFGNYAELAELPGVRRT